MNESSIFIQTTTPEITDFFYLLKSMKCCNDVSLFMDRQLDSGPGESGVSCCSGRLHNTHRFEFEQ